MPSPPRGSPAGATGRAGRAPPRPRRRCAARRRRRRRGRRPAACRTSGRGPSTSAATGSAIPAWSTSSSRQSAMSASLPGSSEPISASRPRQRAPWIVPSSSASRTSSARGPWASRAREQRLAQLAAELAGLVGGGAVDAEPDRRAGWPTSAGTGAMPAPSRALELGQCATPVPVSPKRRTSRSSRCTQWASQTSSPSQPSRSRYSTGRQPNSSRQKRSSSSVSAMCVCRRTPRARASSADSRISSCVTLNGEHGASAIRTIASGDGVVEAVDRVLAGGEDRVAVLDDLVGRQAAVAAAEVHRAAARVEAQPDLARRLDLDLEQVAAVAREEVVVVGGRRAARAGERDEPGARGGLLDRPRRRAPRRGRAPAATRTACCPARARAWPTGRGGGGS